MPTNRSEPKRPATPERRVKSRPAITFAQARLLLAMVKEPGSSLYIESSEHYDYSYGPTFRGYFYHASCPQCHRRDRDGVSWRLIHSLSEAGYIKARWGDDYTAITEAGMAALNTTLRKRPNLAPWRPHNA